MNYRFAFLCFLFVMCIHENAWIDLSNSPPPTKGHDFALRLE